MANNRIRGITIEIDGDVSKLDRALSSVDKTLADTQKKLNDVNRLLKLDPGNVELLDQKQRLLAQNVDLTTNRYETLKKTLDESTASNVNFDKWTKAQTSIQGEITKTENALHSLEKEQKKLADIGVPADSASMVDLQRQIDETTEKAEGLRQKLVDTYEELGRPISIEQYDNLQRELVETRKELEQTEKAAASFHPKLEAVSQKLGVVSQASAEVAQKTRGISAAAGGLVGLLGAAAVKAGQYADDLNTLSKQTGFSTETIQSWQYAADLIDVDADLIIKSVKKMTAAIAKSDTSQGVWAQLGVEVEDAAGKLRSAEDIFFEIMEALSEVDNELKRDTMAIEIFGSSYAELSGLSDDNLAAFRALSEELRQNGGVIPQETLDKMNAFNDGLDEIKAKARVSFAASGAALAESLLPFLDKLVDSLSEILQYVSQLDGDTLLSILKVALIVAAISPIASLISSVTGAVSGLLAIFPTLISGLSSIWALITANPIGMIVTAIAAVIAVLATLYQRNEKFKAFVDGMIEGFIDGIHRVVEAIREALNSLSEFLDKSKLSGSGDGLLFRNDGTLRSAPGFADGAVVAPNNPMLAVIGDNPREPEVVAPYSTIVDATTDAIRRSGGIMGGGQLVGVVTFAGTDQEIARALGPKLELYWDDRGASV